jgi:hypothetical protein
MVYTYNIIRISNIYILVYLKSEHCVRVGLQKRIIFTVGNYAPIYKVKVMLRQTIERSVCFGVKHPSWAHDQVFVTVR